MAPILTLAVLSLTSLVAAEAIPLWPDGGAPGAVAPGQTAPADDLPRIDPYLLPGRDHPAALVVVCPGGAYGRRADHEGAPVARWLNGLGIHAVVCQYRVKPWMHPAPLSDVQRAIRLARSKATEWAVDPQRIGVLGFSAGGHLATSAANFGEDGDPAATDPLARLSSRANALIACYPVISFGEFRHNGSMVNLIGANPDPALRQRMSLETSVTERNPPAFLWHTSNDSAVPVENSLLYALALRQHKVPFALHVYPQGNHGLGLATGKPEVGEWTAACATWLGGIGFAAPKAAP